MNRIVRDFHREARRERRLRIARQFFFVGWVLFCTAAAVRCFMEAMR